MSGSASGFRYRPKSRSRVTEYGGYNLEKQNSLEDQVERRLRTQGIKLVLAVLARPFEKFVRVGR